MALKMMSDIHGEYEALADQLEPDDTAILLGDYLNLLDFRDLGGILAEVYSREEIISALTELAKGKKEKARRTIREIAGGSPEKYQRVVELIEENYREFFSSIPCRSILLYGNTDNPYMMQRFAGDDAEVIESGVITLDGVRFGFVSGSPEGPWTVGLPGEVEVDKYHEMIESLGPVDVLCTHYPPAIPELTWDRLANRDEMGSEVLLDYLDRYQPSHHYFGHVHNPREHSTVRGETKVINTGFFKDHRTAIIHER